MSREWGRESYAGDWPGQQPVGLILTLVISLVTTGAILAYQYERQWPFVERLYLRTYLASEVAAKLGRQEGYYAFLAVRDRKVGPRLAIDGEILPVTLANGKPGVALTEWAASHGAMRLEWQHGKYRNDYLSGQIRHWVFEDQSWWDLTRPASYGGLGVFLIGLVLAIPAERKRRRAVKHGRRLRGPEMVRASEFNRRNRSDGLGFVNRERTIAEVLLGKGRALRVPRDAESNHFLIMGDSGHGKTVLIRQMLVQIEDRSETAIVYDPALEYTPQFYRPERGDLILNPLDQRMPYWKPGDEVRNEAEALTIAASLYPDRPNKDSFFSRGPREVFARMLMSKPGPEELAWWMCHDEEIDRLVKGTDEASTLAHDAAPQREGVLSELKMVGKVFRLLPSEHETKQRWTTLEWSKERRGWLFLTSTPETRERLAPLISLWLDTLVLRLMNQGRPGPRRVWFMLDELATLQKLPQLHTAITENRKSQNPVVLGFQGRSQLEVRYGHEAEAMLSQPGTKIFLRTSEPRAAKWISDAIGEIEVEHLRESRADGYRNRGDAKSYVLERRVEPLVMASEITGLKKLRGYLKSGNLVVRLRTRPPRLPEIAPGFIERSVAERSAPGQRPQPAATNGTGGSVEQKQKPEHSQHQQKAIRVPGRGHTPFFQ
ncbi:MAG TPA: type IV secretion system DNA-binding domain-containing protein [Terriglobia bacterium]|nr:type IV secretion system DNA-binding domain-containing protein [Terriglobia bacterium]